MGNHDERADPPTLWDVDVSGYPAKGSLLALEQEYAPDADEWRVRRCAQHLAACERVYCAGNKEAIIDALVWCEDYDCGPPGWLVDAVIKLVDLRTTPAERRDRREAMLHFDRYDAVRERVERAVERGEWPALDAIYLELSEKFGVCAKSIQRSYLTVREDNEAGRGAKYFQACGRFLRRMSEHRKE